MARPIAEQIVVITGASSGIGREAALRFARAGARVVLAARNGQALQEVARQITATGGRALAVVTDMADWAQVQQVARAAFDNFGGIDTWINNAAVTLYGTFEQLPIDEFQRVIDVVLMGQVRGAKAALPYLKGSAGTLIGVTSVISEVPMPLQSAYTAAKWALKGFYDTLRLEQEHACDGVQVSVIMPSSIDTPLFQNAKSHLGVEPGPIPPVYEPGVVAEAILYAATHPLRDLTVGAGGLLAPLKRIWPLVGEAAVRRLAFTWQLTREPELPSAPNNLWQPVPGKGAIHGGFNALPFDPFTWLRLHPAARGAAAALALAAVALPCAALLARRSIEPRAHRRG
ncbi:MAG TPA: SDR family oxidoreductase [Anaerolineae bacterium]|nr:SDR family oxidoreductase [Anaerolineae bacterium]HPL26719.1 SDR family oxidoreductase [Anaerolineae bacterium]